MTGPTVAELDFAALEDLKARDTREIDPVKLRGGQCPAVELGRASGDVI